MDRSQNRQNSNSILFFSIFSFREIAGRALFFFSLSLLSSSSSFYSRTRERGGDAIIKGRQRRVRALIASIDHYSTSVILTFRLFPFACEFRANYFSTRIGLTQSERTKLRFRMKDQSKLTAHENRTVFMSRIDPHPPRNSDNYNYNYRKHERKDDTILCGGRGGGCHSVSFRNFEEIVLFPFSCVPFFEGEGRKR